MARCLTWYQWYFINYYLPKSNSHLGLGTICKQQVKLFKIWIELQTEFYVTEKSSNSVRNSEEILEFKLFEMSGPIYDIKNFNIAFFKMNFIWYHQLSVVMQTKRHVFEFETSSHVLRVIKWMFPTENHVKAVKHKPYISRRVYAKNT